MSDQKESILLVDDDGFLIDMYALKFKQCGMDVEAITDPAAALKKLRDGFVPTMLLLDVIMPGMTGFEVLAAIKKEGLAKGSKIIILSNQGQEEDLKKAQDLGVDGYIIKASAIPSEVCTQALAIAHGTKK